MGIKITGKQPTALELLRHVHSIPEVNMDRIRIRCPAGYLQFFSDQEWIWIFIFEKNWIRTGSGCLFDFYNEISQRVFQDVTNDGSSVFFAYDNSCYFIVNFFLVKWK